MVKLGLIIPDFIWHALGMPLGSPRSSTDILSAGWLPKCPSGEVAARVQAFRHRDIRHSAIVTSGEPLQWYPKRLYFEPAMAVGTCMPHVFSGISLTPPEFGL